jgi:integrase
MGKRASVRWHEKAGCYCSDAGEPVVDKSGRLRRQTVYFRGIAKSDRRKAQDALDRLVQTREEQIVTEGDLKIGQLVQLYLAWSEGHARPLTFTGHRKILSKFLRATHGAKSYRDKLAKDFTATDLTRIISAWLNAGHGPNYIGRMVASVQAMLNWAAAPIADREPERLILANPIKGFSHEATRAPRSPDRFAPDEEIASFLGFLRKRIEGLGGENVKRFEGMTADMIEVAALTGARPGELRVAEWTDYDPEAVELGAETWGRIRLDTERWKAGGKTGEFREVFLPPEAVAIIERIKAHPNHHPRFIWTHKRGARSATRGADVRVHGEPWSESSLPTKILKLRRIAIAAGVALADKGENRFVLYRLRHTAAARLLMAGVPVALVAKILGTSPEMITRVYGSYLSKSLVEAAALGLIRKSTSDESSSDAPRQADPSRPNLP